MMKLLKNITASLTESEDDLFPGLTASAFDEHNTLQSTKRTSADESEWLDKHLERVKLLEKAKTNEFNRVKQAMMNNDLWIQSWNVTVGNVGYKSVAGMESKFPLAYDLLANVSFDPKSSAKADIPIYVARLERALVRMQELKLEMKKIKTRASSTRRAATAAEMKNQKASASKTKIHEANIPKTIVVKYFNGNVYKPQGTSHQWESERKSNPYFDVSNSAKISDRYAGHPVHFKWEKREKTSFFLLSKFVLNMGLPELSILYATRFSTGGLTYYMENADKSVQVFKTQYGGIDVYIQDTKLDTWDKFIDINTITKFREDLDLNADLIKKYGKKP